MLTQGNGSPSVDDEKLVAVLSSDEFVGPIEWSARRSTDILFLLLIITAWFTSLMVGFSSLGWIQTTYLSPGVPARLLRGVDYQGSICGDDNIVKNLPKKWLPNVSGTNKDSLGQLVPPGLGICVSSCPLKGESRSDPYGKYGSWTAPSNTYNWLGYCLPEYSNSPENLVESMFADFIRSAKVVALAGFLLSIFICILFLVVIRIPLVLRSTVWLCVLVVFVVFAGGGYSFLTRAKEVEAGGSSYIAGSSLGTVGGEHFVTGSMTLEVGLLKGVGGALSACALIWLCVICLMRERIAIAIGLVREASKALLAIPSLVLVLPLLQTAVFAAFTTIALVFSVYLASSGNIVTTTDATTGYSYKTVSFDENSKGAIALVFCVWLWTVGFVEALGQLTAAHSVLEWYFAPKRSEVGFSQLFASLRLILRFHMGTAAIGSFLVTLLRIARMILEYIKYKLGNDKSGGSGGGVIGGITSRIPCANSLVRLLLGCLNCCLCCFESCLKYLNKHAYIQCALFGTPFLPSARRAFGLLLRNMGITAAVALVGDFVLMIAKLSITLTCAGIAFLYTTNYMHTQLHGHVLPALLVALIAFTTSTLFMSALSAACDTILQAYIVDDEMFGHCVTDNSKNSRATGNDGAGGGPRERARIDADEIPGQDQRTTLEVHMQEMKRHCGGGKINAEGVIDNNSFEVVQLNPAAQRV